MNIKKQVFLTILIVSLILLLLMNYDSGFVFKIEHTYEIGSVRKPREMRWTTINWKMIIPLFAAVLSSIGLYYFSKERKINMDKQKN